MIYILGCFLFSCKWREGEMIMLESAIQMQEVSENVPQQQATTL